MDTIMRSFALRSQVVAPVLRPSTFGLIMLNRATSDKSEPTPGYLFSDIAKLTFESSEMSHDLMNYLLSRLKKKSVHTKLKTLKILKYCVEKGDEGFVQDLQKRSEDLRLVTEFKGTVDPLHGDTFNKQVRQNASILMEAVFNPKNSGPRDSIEGPKSRIAKDAIGSSQSQVRSTLDTPSTTPSTAHPTARMSSSHLSNSNENVYYTETTSASGMKMWGMGSAPAKSDSFVDKVKSKVSQVKGRVSNALRDKGRDEYVDIPSDTHSEMERSFHSRTGTQQTRLSPNVENYQSKQTSPGTYQAPIESALAVDGYTSISTDPEYIARVVQNITAPGGVKAAPPQQDLDEFVTKCKTLDGHHVADALFNRLEEAGTDRETLRILYVVKALAASPIIGIEACLEPLRDLLEEFSSGNHNGIKKKSLEIIGTLDKREQSYRETKSSLDTQEELPDSIQPQQKQKADPINLLDLDDQVQHQSATSGGEAQDSLQALIFNTTESSTQGPSSLFSEMSVISENSSLQSPSALTSKNTTSQRVSQNPAGNSSLFSGMALASDTLSPVASVSNNTDTFNTHKPVVNSHATTPQSTSQSQDGKDKDLLDLTDLFSSKTTTSEESQQTQNFGSLLESAPSTNQNIVDINALFGKSNQQGQHQDQSQLFTLQKTNTVPSSSPLLKPTVANSSHSSSFNPGNGLYHKQSQQSSPAKKADVFDFVAQELGKSRK
eukprot:gene10711-2807_t